MTQKAPVLVIGAPVPVIEQGLAQRFGSCARRGPAFVVLRWRVAMCASTGP